MTPPSGQRQQKIYVSNTEMRLKEIKALRASYDQEYEAVDDGSWYGLFGHHVCLDVMKIGMCLLAHSCIDSLEMYDY